MAVINAAARIGPWLGAVDVAGVVKALGPTATVVVVFLVCACYISCTWLKSRDKNQGSRKATPARTPKGAKGRKPRATSKSK